MFLVSLQIYVTGSHECVCHAVCVCVFYSKILKHNYMESDVVYWYVHALRCKNCGWPTASIICGKPCSTVIYGSLERLLNSTVT